MTKQKNSTTPISLRKLIEETIQKKQPKTVEELTRIIQEERKDVTIEEIISIVKELQENGRIALNVPVPVFHSFADYLMAPYWSLSFWLVIATISLTLFSIYVLPEGYPLVALRWILGLIFVLFIPGYSFIQALFPGKKDLDNIERFALSIGLSLALVPLTGLLLNFTPWGIRLNPIVVALCVLSLTLIFIGAYRKYILISRKS